ncbi:MAG: TatD family hydrolase [Clostridiales bacterium]|nr:TatD family hydrolase [Clostridiales bacterium]
MTIFDSHSHLDDPCFDNDRDEIVLRAKENGVKYILNPGATLASSVKAVEMARKYDIVYAAVGVHPHDVKDMDENTIGILRGLSESDKVVAYGEIGLDYYYNHSPKELQLKWFIRQIQLAKELKLPIIVHDREAHGEVFEILSKYKVWEDGCVMHCYSGSAELAKEYVKKGIYISLAGPVTFKNAKKTHEVAKEIPLEWLMAETDAPYLAPVPLRGKRNEPSYVKYIVDAIAKVKRIDFEKVSMQLAKNSLELFDLQK